MGILLETWNADSKQIFENDIHNTKCVSSFVKINNVIPMRCQ